MERPEKAPAGTSVSRFLYSHLGIREGRNVCKANKRFVNIDTIRYMPNTLTICLHYDEACKPRERKRWNSCDVVVAEITR